MAGYHPDNPLIVQGDRTILVEVNNPLYAEVRGSICRFAQLEKSPEYLHTYSLTPLSIWNAAAVGLTIDEILNTLSLYSKYELPLHLVKEISELHARYGLLTLIKKEEDLELVSKDPMVTKQVELEPTVKPFLISTLSESRIKVDPKARGLLKQALVRLGYPVDDRAGFAKGNPLNIRLRNHSTQAVFSLRPYQEEAAHLFCEGGDMNGRGSGVIVLPCGAGKTIVGLAILSRLKCWTLILTTGVTAARQWKREILEKTFLTEKDVGEYTGEKKEVCPVTLTTYQMITHRSPQSDEFKHFNLFLNDRWGLIIYDEVHLLPAQIFRITADLQARRRLGLTATLVREDGKEEDVFSLIGPKRYDVPWKTIEAQGWIAPALCTEIRVPFSDDQRLIYAAADKSEKIRLAAENPAKVAVIESLVRSHNHERVLLIGHYLSQLTELAQHLNVPLITGQTNNTKREELYADFRKGTIPILAVSKVGNFSVDLPDANVLIQVSGTFGSRQEEAQRLGRILRPKSDASQALFYSLVTAETIEQRFSEKRQRFLTEQGYSYNIWIHSEMGEKQVEKTSQKPERY